MFEKTSVNLRKYAHEDGLNLQFIIDYFSPAQKDTTRPDPLIKIRVDDLKFIASSFAFRDDEKAGRRKGAVDFSDILLSNLNIHMKDVNIICDSVAADIRQISFREKSGFTLRTFSSNTVVSPRNIIANKLKIITPLSSLDLDLKFAYGNFNDFDDFVNRVDIRSALRASSLNMMDIAAFVPEMAGMNNLLKISAQVKGRVRDLKIRKILLGYGNHTFLDGDLSMNGLPDIEETYFNLKIRTLVSSAGDLKKVYLPSPAGSQSLILPAILDRLGDISVRGSFTGFYSSFVAYATVNSNIGTLITDVIMNNRNNVLSYKGRVATQNLNLGVLSGSPEILGVASMSVQLEGSGMNLRTASFDVEGNVNSIQIRGYDYTNLKINGGLDNQIITGTLDVNDQNLKMLFNGVVNLSDSLPAFDLVTDIGYANLKNLNLGGKDSISEIEGLVNLDFKGNHIDNIEGTIQLTNGSFKENQKRFVLKNFLLRTDINDQKYRKFELSSDYVDAEFRGYFVFRNLYESFKKFVKFYLPGIDLQTAFSGPDTVRQDFDFDIRLYNATPFLRHFVSNVELAANTEIRGRFNSLHHEVSVSAISSSIEVFGRRFTNWRLDAGTPGDSLQLSMYADTLYIADSSWLNHLTIRAGAVDDSVTGNLSWDNYREKKRNAGNINLFAFFYPNDQEIIGFKYSTLTINDSLWKFNPLGFVQFDSSRIYFSNVGMYRGDQNISVNGALTRNPLEMLNVDFSRFNLSHLDYLTNMEGFDLDGIISGKLVISDIYGNPTYFADVSVNRLGFNHDLLGDAEISTRWDDKNKGLKIDAEVLYKGSAGTGKPLAVAGYYYPNSANSNFDLNVGIENFKLRTLSRYISSFGTIVNGTATGNIRITGPNRAPELSGNIRLMRTVLKINYLNTTYAFAYDSLKITNESFSFRDIVLFDQPNNDTALLSGVIRHRHFKDFYIDIGIEPRKFNCLNTTAAQNEYFYGTAYATGMAHIFGPVDNIRMEIQAKTEKNTMLYIPVGGSTTVGQATYITFVGKDNVSQAAVADPGRKESGISLDMTFDVTDLAEIQIVFDPRTGDRIRCKGNGDIRMTIGADGTMKLYGDYTLASGDYLFSFQNILNKHFNIQNGSTVKWNGDPYEALLDITAIYKLKANLSGLGIDTNRRLVPVECIINIRDKLSKPEFSFAINLPSLNDFEKMPYITAINQNLNDNFISLLIVNSFVRSSIATGSNYAGAEAGMIWRSASEALSNQLSNLLSQVSKNVDVGINYRPGDNITQEEIEVALSTQLFNDRVTIESNLGVSTGQGGTGKTSNQIVGDVNVEVKLSKNLKLKVYNKSNQYDILQNIAPYTQGIGISYRKEFNHIRELFKRTRKADKKKPGREGGKKKAGD